MGGEVEHWDVERCAEADEEVYGATWTGGSWEGGWVVAFGVGLAVVGVEVELGGRGGFEAAGDASPFEVAEAWKSL